MKLNKETFISIIDSTPLVSIDLIVKNEHGQALLGYRHNRPAQGYWFVPGGRIRKNEKLQEALTRITRSELGVVLEQGKLLGAFDHFYEDNNFGVDGIKTHYVALGYVVEIPGQQRFDPDEQHAELKWWDVDELLHSSQVHEYTKSYFRAAGNHAFRCG